MNFDPFGIEEYHEDIRARIGAGEPGFAQTILGEVMVSFEAASFRGPVFAHFPISLAMLMSSSDVLEEMILDVARKEGIASPTTFRRRRVERMVEDRRAYPAAYPKMRRQAELLHDFYLKPGAEAANLLF